MFCNNTIYLNIQDKTAISSLRVDDVILQKLVVNVFLKHFFAGLSATSCQSIPVL